MWNRSMAPTGRFRFRLREQRWEWSREVAALYGYPAETMAPPTELLLTHNHPDDHTAVADTLAAMLETGRALSRVHRIIDTAGDVHHVLVVGERWDDDNGTAVGTAGYYIDVTRTLEETRRETLDKTLPRLVAGRQAIEQAKGALMLVYGLSAEHAFRVLIWRSQETNTKLRILAEELVASLARFGGAAPTTRTRFDHLLLTTRDLR
ncbi:hypothetical protein NBRGN_026_00650 [Nocardia brasiliensis NBRC 14402]|nr:ANTAR domain-containing protein [Nocardia brasiliensis]GAJ80312.1 hypothetical protein NBRGN_026_00650 [Nocardia brasiliensis NBRC 14402]SUB40388.1 ANTAR domain [Nocardia brasiliensis]